MSQELRKIYSLGQIAKLLGVHRKTLTYWVKGGKLRASRTPGGHFRVLHEDFVNFVEEHGMRILADDPKPQKKTCDAVLAIDDDRGLLELLEYVFREAPEFEFHGVDNGYLGLIEAGRLHPAVIILDLMMPGLDGWELLASLRRSGSELVDRIVVLSAVLDDAADRRLSNLGIRWRLSKPFDYRRLVDLAREVVQATTHTAGAGPKGEH